MRISAYDDYLYRQAENYMEEEEQEEIMTDAEEISILKDHVDVLYKENEKLKEELKNYSNVINQLYGVDLSNMEEVGRLIEIARFGNWSEL